MFTGIVEATGEVGGTAQTGVPGGGYRLHLKTPLAGSLNLGDSLAINGCCLTVAERLPEGLLGFDLLAESLRRTNLGDLSPRDLVNLERPMAASGRFDGHMVQGHVDQTARVLAIEPIGCDYRVEVELPPGFARYVVFKGSIAVNGISLTVAELTADAFVLWIIPHTWEVTNLRQLKPGRRVNLEFDVIAKYVERMLEARLAGSDVR